MRRLFVLGVVAVGAVALARRAARRCGGLDFEAMVERMPENAPPRWMFRTMSGIRENTERILELLEAERAPAAGGREREAA